MLTNRRDDSPWIFAAFIGVLILAATFFLKFKVGLNDIPYAIGLILGSGLVSPNIIMGMIVKWRTGGNPDFPDPPRRKPWQE